MAKNTRKDMRVFGLAMAVVLGGIGTWLLLKDKTTAGVILVSCGAVFALLAVFAVDWLKPLYGPWMKFAAVLGFVMTRVVLTLFYYLVLSPIGLFRRLFRLDSLDRRLSATAITQWNDRDRPAPPKAQYERQF